MKGVAVDEADFELPEPDNDTFPIAEGLQLLANFRAIQSPEVRAKIIKLVGTLGRTKMGATDNLA